MKMAAFVPFGVGLLFIVISILLGSTQTAKRNRCTMLTVGRVADYAYDSFDNSNSGTWHPIFEYSANGRQIRKQSRYGGNKQFEIGEKVTVRYNPENVEDFYVEEQRTPDALRKVFLFAGIPLLLIGLLILLTVALAARS